MYNDRTLSTPMGKPAAQAIPVMASLGFVSRRGVFSDCLCRATEAELPGLQVTRFNDIHDVMEKASDGPDYLRLVILDEGAAETLDVVQARWLARHCGTLFACAYGSQDRAMRLIGNAAYPDPLGSLFPLNMGIDAWISVLKLCLIGHHYVAPELVIIPPRDASPSPSEGARLAGLTRREREVLKFVAEGCQNKEIAARLDLSENTIKLHLRNIISKLGVHNRTEAAMIHAQHYRQ